MDVLIVEDARDQRLLLSAVVKKLGYTVHQAADGLEALAVLEKNPCIHLVISDWMMPGLDGQGLCEAVRGERFGRYIYFILLTGKNERQDMVQALSHGADDFLGKPVDFAELEVRLKSGCRVVSLEQRLEEKNRQLARTLSAVEQDIAAAAKTQQSFLPAAATIRGVGFEWRFQPSRVLGGDMFGYRALGDDHVMFYQLDVAGHGISSALFSFALNKFLMDTDSLHFVAGSKDSGKSGRIPAPTRVLERLNRRFQATAEAMLYFTITYGVIEQRSGLVTLVHAGHPASLWLRRREGQTDLERIADTGVPVGMMPDMQWNCRQFHMQPGDRLFMYSDGVTECENPEGDMLGEDRLESALRAGQTLPLSQMANQVWETLCRWRGNQAFDDDVTCLVLEYQGGNHGVQ